MRKLKFRAWDNLTQEFIDRRMFAIGNEWEMLVQTFEDPYLYPEPMTAWFIVSSEGHRVDLMQFTWFLDKNGKEIYEGDILDCYWVIFECVFDMWSFEAVNWDEYSHLGWWTLWKDTWDIDDAVIIWNIYENPDLIK